MWLLIYDIYFIFYSALIFYFTISKKVRKEGIQSKTDIILPVISMACPVLLNFSGEIRELSLTWLVLIFIFFGLFLSTWGLFTLKKNFSIFIEAIGVIKTGPYKFIKHPIYLGELFITFGFALVINSVLAYLVFLLCIILVLIRAKMEEKKLIKVFPEEMQYFNSTPAFIPFLHARSKKK
jgi:protein-S-isoprenylcysteine O-methyltransferase Ste14